MGTTFNSEIIQLSIYLVKKSGWANISNRVGNVGVRKNRGGKDRGNGKMNGYNYSRVLKQLLSLTNILMHFMQVLKRFAYMERTVKLCSTELILPNRAFNLDFLHFGTGTWNLNEVRNSSWLR